MGSVSQAAEKYMKASCGGSSSMEAGNAPSSGDLKVGNSLHKSMQSACKLLGRYRMHFAWGARQVYVSEYLCVLIEISSCCYSLHNL